MLTAHAIPLLPVTSSIFLFLSSPFYAELSLASSFICLKLKLAKVLAILSKLTKRRRRKFETVYESEKK